MPKYISHTIASHYLIWVSVFPSHNPEYTFQILKFHLRNLIIYGMIPYRIDPLHSKNHITISKINHIKTINKIIVTYGDLQLWNPCFALHCVVTGNDNCEAIEWFHSYLPFLHHICINEVMFVSSIYQN